MIRIKNIQRIAVAAKDLDATIAKYKKLFGIVPFNYGIAKEEKYHWCAFEMGEGQCTMEVLSPYEDPNIEGIITKYIDKRGEGLYMVTLRTEGDAEEVVSSMKELGLEPSWGSVGWEDALLNASGDMAASWQEHYVHPKETSGVLMTLATIKRKIVDEPATCPDDFRMEVGKDKKK
ncbi:VOC family protein [Spirochaetota bacterium]